MRSALEIRAVESASDFRSLHRLFVEYETELPSELRHGSVPPLSELSTTYAEKNRAFIALFDGSAIGCVAARELDSETALLLRLYVEPAHRGRGAARALVASVIEFVREGAYRRIVLDTNRTALEPAYRLYRSMGFVDCEPFMPVSYECPTFMELELSRRSDLNR